MSTSLLKISQIEKTKLGISLFIGNIGHDIEVFVGEIRYIIARNSVINDKYTLFSIQNNQVITLDKTDKVQLSSAGFDKTIYTNCIENLDTVCDENGDIFIVNINKDDEDYFDITNVFLVDENFIIHKYSNRYSNKSHLFLLKKANIK
jgi:hypothetical protein